MTSVIIIREVCLYKKVKVYIKELTLLSTWGRETPESGERNGVKDFVKIYQLKNVEESRNYTS